MSINRNYSIILLQLYGTMQPPDAEPLSIEVIAASIINRFPYTNIELHCVSKWDYPDSIQNAADSIQKKNGVIVGISIPQSTLKLANELIDSIYHVNHNAFIVLGHALPTYSPEIFLEKYPDLIIVRGWGEDSFVQLVEHYQTGRPHLNNISNLYYRNKKHSGRSSTLIKWPKVICSPKRICNDNFYPRVEASRGCSYNVCTFCTRQLQQNKSHCSWQRRPVLDVLSDIQQLKSLGKNIFTLADEDFIGNDLDGAINIASGIGQLRDMRFSLALRVDDIHNPKTGEEDNNKREELLVILRNAGLYLTYVGVESLSGTQLSRFGKGITVIDCIKSIEVLQRLDISFELGSIIFDPLSTENELLENVHMLEETNLWRYFGQLFNYLRPQKHSPYSQRLSRLGLLQEYNPDAMFYNFLYQDAIVGFVARSCDLWYREFDPVYLLLRNIVRNKPSDVEYYGFIIKIRNLMFRCLKQATNVAKEDQSIQIFENFNCERNHYIRELYSYVKSKTSITNSESQLKNECESFLTHHTN